MKIPQYNSFHLKYLAVVTMTIDHIGAIVLNALIPAQAYLYQSGSIYDIHAVAKQWQGLYWLMLLCRLIGRLAFPIFCFLLVQGFLHTRNRLQYALRLAIFALLSEPFFDMAVHQRLFDLQSQNVFLTLLLGLLLLWLWQSSVALPIRLIGCGGLAVIAAWSQCDYDVYGLALIFILYRLTVPMPIVRETAEPAIAEQGTTYQLTKQPYSLILLGFYLLYQMTACLSLFFLRAYNGQRGRKQGLWFYLYYPLHLALLVLVRFYCTGQPLL